MALVTCSNSLCARNWSSSDCKKFNNLNLAFTSTVYAARSEFPVTDSSWSGQVGKHASLQKIWPSSSFWEKRKRRCHVRPNASTTPESQTTDENVDSSSSDVRLGGVAYRSALLEVPIDHEALPFVDCQSVEDIKLKPAGGIFPRAVCAISLGASAADHLRKVIGDFSCALRMSAQSRLDLSDTHVGLRKTIAQQLEEDVELKAAEEVTIALGNGKLDINSSDLTISQKRNIRRQDYLNKVSKRDDAPFFTIVALFVLVPPAAILGVAVATGYIDLLP